MLKRRGSGGGREVLGEYIGYSRGGGIDRDIYILRLQVNSRKYHLYTYVCMQKFYCFTYIMYTIYNSKAHIITWLKVYTYGILVRVMAKIKNTHIYMYIYIVIQYVRRRWQTFLCIVIFVLCANIARHYNIVYEQFLSVNRFYSVSNLHFGSR